MSKSRTTIPVFFTADNNYVPWLATAIHSLIKNASRDYGYRIYVLHDGISPENISRISRLAEPGFEIIFDTMRESFEGIDSEFIGNKLRADYFTLTIYFRIFIPSMFPQYDKGIYIDSDVVVPGDISELYNTALGSNLIAACPDYSIQEIEPLMDYVTQAVGVDRGIEYINSGVLLMDFKGLREARFGERFLELLNRYHFDSVAPDQDYINSMCKGRIHFLAEEWDAMPNNNKPALPSPKIIHFNLFEKPWMRDGIQYGKYFWHYAGGSGYLEDIRRFKDAYTEEQKAADLKCMQAIVERGIMIASGDGPKMKEVFESGREARL